MQLLSKKEVDTHLKKRRDSIKEESTRLLSYLTKGQKRLNNLKDDYGPDREKKLKEFEAFCHTLNEKKNVLLKELNAYNKLIEERKEIYYGLVEKQDELEEKTSEMEAKKRNLDDRERFIIQSEEKLEAKWRSLIKKDA